MASQSARSAFTAAVPGAAKELLTGIPYVVSFSASGVGSMTFDLADHGFATVSAVQVSLKSATAPTQTAVTYNISGTDVVIYFWKATATADTALIEDTGAVAGSIAIWGTP
jgi:hypothetical protein